MMFRIGIDFDNTIACYDQAFPYIAELLGIHSDQKFISKFEFKKWIQQLPNGDNVWQRIQGQVYGKYMYFANIYPGVLEFICLAKIRGHEVFVVSHKSEFGHFDDEKISLRYQAMLWLEKNCFCENNKLSLNKDSVFFEATRDEKIQRIKALGCTHFIDDLSEVFFDDKFPIEINKFLFSPSNQLNSNQNFQVISSWKNIAKHILHPWTEEEVCHAIQEFFPQLEVIKSELQVGRANSIIYKLTNRFLKNYILKVYPDLQKDKRPRLSTEYLAIQELALRGYPVPQIIAVQENLGWAIYEWIDGSPFEIVDRNFINDALSFIQCIARDSKEKNAFTQFQVASEACLSGSDIEKQIKNRLNKLLIIRHPELTDFLLNSFYPTLVIALSLAKKIMLVNFNDTLSKAFQILSPSDFGSHNALKSSDGRIKFIDFEYFGWDDPVKLISDFYWHPGMTISLILRHEWIARSMYIFENDYEFSKRLNAYLPLFGLRWCLIILNEFLKSEASKEINNQPELKIKNFNQCSFQLKKAIALLNQVKEELNHGSKIKIA